MPEQLLEFLKTFLTPERLARIEEVLAQRTRFVTVVLENVHRTQNASACLRTCEAFGVQDVHILPNEAGFKVNRDIAQGSVAWLTLHKHPAAEGVSGCFSSLRRSGSRIVAVSGDEGAGLLSNYEPQTPTALVFGNERDGLSPAAREHADEVRRLPMFGFTESLNLSVAVGLALREIIPKIRAADAPWPLSEEDRQVLREAWIRRSLGRRVQRIEREFHRRFSSDAVS